jgi:hypothetical protein
MAKAPTEFSLVVDSHRQDRKKTDKPDITSAIYGRLREARMLAAPDQQVSLTDPDARAMAVTVARGLTGALAAWLVAGRLFAEREKKPRAALPRSERLDSHDPQRAEDL